MTKWRMKYYDDRDFFREAGFPFFINRYTICKGEIIPDHSHSFFEFVYVVKGNAVHETNGKCYRLKTGDVFIISPNEVHSYKGSDEEDTVVYNLMFRLDLLKNELQGLTDIPQFVDFFYLSPFFRKTTRFNPYVSVDGSTRSLMETRLQVMQFEAQRKYQGYELIIRTQLIELFVHLSRYMLVRNPSIYDSLFEQDWMNWLHAMAEQYYKESITLKEFSRMCGMSPSSLSQKFKLRTGSSFVQYKHHLQSKEACRLLIETDLPIIRIAGETGFDDLSYFYRVFRKVVGETPSQYRKKRKERLSGRIAAEDDPV